MNRNQISGRLLGPVLAGFFIMGFCDLVAPITGRIAADFPKTNFIISHGGWPWVQQILGVCFFQKNIYLCPDMYLFNCSGAADYIMAANNFMQDRFLFGTAYPLMPIVDCVSHFKGLFKPEVLPKLLYKNAAKLLNIELPEEA